VIGVTQQDESWLAELDHLPPEHEVAPGVTVAQLAQFHSRPPTPPGCAFEPDVVYGAAGPGGRPLHLDVYRRTTPGPPRPGVLFVHGGSWADGHRYTHIRRACLLAGEGWVTATMSYRLSGEARWPAPLADVKCALRWMRSQAAWLGLDRHRLAVAGNSAGGHLAAMAALTPGELPPQELLPAELSEQSDAVAAAVLWYPVTDLDAVPALRRQVQALLGGRRRRLRSSASPVDNVSAAAPPILSMTGSDDDVVPVASVVRFHQVLTQAGCPNALHVYPGAGHAFDFLPELWEDSFTRCKDFLGQVLGPAS
jgi:acetyl esterase/lipase